jgi:predicted Zn finger-like uncharacterized protein
MIIQCDQCKTKFRLDDSKVTDAGVKVRCSRCKNTFVVRKEVNEDIAGLQETFKNTGSLASETEKQDYAASGILAEQKTALSEERNEMFRETDSSLNRMLPPVETAQDTTENDGNGPSIDDFGSFDTSFAYTGKGVDAYSDEHRIGEDDEEEHSESSGGEFPGVVENETEVCDAESKHPGMEDFDGESGKNAYVGGFSESPVFSESPEDDFSQFAGSETAPEQSWDIFPPAAGPETKTPAISGKEFFLNCIKDDKEDYKVFSAGMDESEMLSTESVPSESGLADDQFESEGEPVSEKNDYLLDIMSAASGINEQSSKTYGDAAEAIEEDPPPLAISSRKKRNLFLPVAVAVLLVIVVAAGSAAYYFSWIDFSFLNIPALSSITGREVSNLGGKITIRNLDGFYLRNAYGGEIFVVTGEAFNRSDKAFSSVRVRGYIYGSKGQVLLDKPASFLNILSRDQLTTLPVNEIEALSKNNHGKSSDDMPVQPGTAATFQIVFSHVPEGAGEFGAQVAGPSDTDQ